MKESHEQKHLSDAEKKAGESVFSIQKSDMDAPVRKKKKDLFSILSMTLILLCCIGVAVSAFYLTKTIFTYVDEKQLYDDLRDRFYGDADGEVAPMSHSDENVYTPDLLAAQKGETPTLPGVSASEADEYALLRSKLAALQAEYPDIKGWIKISNTLIDYPVLQTNNNSFYINHGYNGKKLSAGSIFMDFRSSPVPDDNYNTVIYGHNIIDGTMFRTLQYFNTNESLFRDGRIVYITADAVYIYEAFSVHQPLDTDDYTQVHFYNQDQYERWLEGIKKESEFKKDISVTSGDTVLTLSTCTNYLYDEHRFAVHAVLTQVIR